MKTIFRILVCLAILTVSVSCCAETVTYGSFSADSGAEYLDLKIEKPVDWNALYDFLAKFPNLKKVDMFDIPVSSRAAYGIHERFPDIEFGMTMCFAEHTVRTDDTAFSTLHDNAEWHSCSQLSVVRFCKNMYALDIGHNSFDDLSFLYDMPQLRVLIVACGDATDITPIGSLKHLEYLEIFHNRIEDISCLKDMPYLMDLNIVNNLIDDISPVKELKSLKRLWIGNHSRRLTVEDDEVILPELQAALPDCHIDYTSTSTAGGWRTDPVTREKHPHYDVIYRMFRAKVYEPFADSPPENIPEGFAPRKEE